MGVPFGGFKQSGMGKEFGQYALDACVVGVIWSIEAITLTRFAFVDTPRLKLFILTLVRDCNDDLNMRYCIILMITRTPILFVSKSSAASIAHWDVNLTSETDV